MSKWHGAIGFCKTVNTTPGVWEDEITVRFYEGDLIRNIQRFQSSEHLNDNVNVSNKLSIIADSFIMDNFKYMKYIEYMGINWKVGDIEIQYPRLYISFGGVYNGAEQPTAKIRPTSC